MSSRPLVAVTRAIPEVGLDLLRDHVDIRLWEQDIPPTPEELDTLLEGCDGALTLLTDRIDAATLERHPGLRFVSNFAVGYDNIDVDACTAHGVAVTNTPGVLTKATAEFAFALLMATARRIPEATSFVEDGKWVTWGPKLLLGQQILGATLGIVGFGRIGQGMARMAAGFGMRVLVNNRRQDPKLANQFDVTFVDFLDLLKESDFVSLHVALTPETHHLIGKRELQLMKSSAVLINAARGPVVDTDALVDALSTGEIFAAGLDVTDPEPLPADHPLVSLPNCVVVPHIASATVQTRNAMASLAARNIVELVHGRRPSALVNPSVLDKEQA
jgi:glyoxylate reductase